MKLIVVVFLFSNLFICHSSCKEHVKPKLSKFEEQEKIKLQSEMIHDQIYELYAIQDSLSNKINELCSFIDQLNLRDFPIKNILKELVLIDHPLMYNYFVQNLFYEIQHSAKMRPWDTEEFPFYTIIFNSSKRDYFNYAILNSTLLNDCKLSDAKIKMIYILLIRGTLDFNEMIERSSIYYPSETCRIVNLKRFITLDRTKIN